MLDFVREELYIYKILKFRKILSSYNRMLEWFLFFRVLVEVLILKKIGKKYLYILNRSKVYIILGLVKIYIYCVSNYYFNSLWAWLEIYWMWNFFEVNL